MKNYIRNSIYFNKLNDLDYNAILRCFNVRIHSYKKGEFIINTGDAIQNIFIVANGNVRSYYNDVNGKLIIDKEYCTDDIFGSNYIFLGIKNAFEDYIALNDVTCIICDGFRFFNPCENRCKRHLDVLKMQTIKSAELERKTLQRVHCLCQGKTRIKILTYLKTYNKDLNTPFKIPFNKGDLANYLGVERSALSTELNILKKEGIIDFNGLLYTIKKKV